MAMATNRIVLFQLGTLCFVLFMLLLPAAHGKNGRGVLMLSGTARCKSNPSRTVNNATLQVTINGTMVATGETNSSGHFLLVANVTSRDQLMALIKKEVAFTALSGSCGDAVPAGRKLAAAADDDVDITDLAMVISPVDQLVDDILNSLPVDDADLPPEIREEIMAFLDQVQDSSKSFNIDSLGNFIEETGVVEGYDLLNVVMDFVGTPSIYSSH